MRVAVHTRDFVAVGFQIPLAEFHTAASLERHRSVQNLGPDVLTGEFDADAAVEQLRSLPYLEIGEALLCQALVAAMENVFKSEACFASRVKPFGWWRRFRWRSCDEYTGMRRTTGRANPEERLYVYGRRGEPCRECGATIVSRKQGEDARVTFWCPRCQRMTEPVR